MGFLVHALIIVLIAGCLLLLAAGAAFFVLRRLVRRRWRSVRHHVATRGVLAALAAVAAWRDRMGSRATPEELSRGPASRARRHMWVAIEDAQVAVSHADAIDAPVAELPAICRTLRTMGDQLDQLLRLEKRLPQDHGRPEAVRTQVAEVIRASRDVQLAALQVSGDATGPQIRSLVRDAHDEVEILAAALSRLRSATR